MANDPGFDEAFKHLTVSDTTKNYLLKHKELLEKYVKRMNAASPFGPEVGTLRKQLLREGQALYATYVGERKRQGLPSEVGWMGRR
jgi:hypothetical protein